MAMSSCRWAASSFVMDFSVIAIAAALAPGNLATVFDINAAYNKGIDGTGQTIAVAGQTDFIVSDITSGTRGPGPGPIRRVPAEGGAVTDVTALDPSQSETQHTLPNSLPDGRHFIYSRWGGPVEKQGVFVGSLDLKPAEKSRPDVILVKPRYG